MILFPKTNKALEALESLAFEGKEVPAEKVRAIQRGLRLEAGRTYDNAPMRRETAFSRFTGSVTLRENKNAVVQAYRDINARLNALLADTDWDEESREQSFDEAVQAS